MLQLVACTAGEAGIADSKEFVEGEGAFAAATGAAPSLVLAGEAAASSLPWRCLAFAGLGVTGLATPGLALAELLALAGAARVAGPGRRGAVPPAGEGGGPVALPGPLRVARPRAQAAHGRVPTACRQLHGQAGRYR